MSFGEKLGKATKELLNEEKIKPEELDREAQTAKKQIENMWDNRAYKTKVDGTKITLEELTTTERYKTLILLNKTFGQEDINILLSQSKTLQQENIQEYSNLVKTLQQTTNQIEQSLNKKIKETNTFKKYVNQLGFYDYNTGELAVKMWKNADETLKTEIKNYPKTFFSIVSGFGPVASAPEA